jgi:hypothetical protein
MIEKFLQPDTKIFAALCSFSIFDNNLLTRTMNKYWDYDNDNNKIKTGFDSCEPRLLLVCVDSIDIHRQLQLTVVCVNKYLDGKGS